MPIRQRHNTGGGTAGADLPLLTEGGLIEGHNALVTRCCIPLSTLCMRDYEPINVTAPVGCVKVACNNEACHAGSFMHAECFQVWQSHVLAYLKSSGRARSWSEKQRLQNLWTKRGYDLAYKACGCVCGKGHLRKDLDWSPPTVPEPRLRRRKPKTNPRPQQQQQQLVLNNNNKNRGWAIPIVTPSHHRANSLSSGGSTPPSDESLNNTPISLSSLVISERNRYYTKKIMIQFFSVI